MGEYVTGEYSKCRKCSRSNTDIKWNNCHMYWYTTCEVLCKSPVGRDHCPTGIKVGVEVQKEEELKILRGLNKFIWDTFQTLPIFGTLQSGRWLHLEAGVPTASQTIRNRRSSRRRRHSSKSSHISNSSEGSITIGCLKCVCLSFYQPSLD